MLADMFYLQTLFQVELEAIPRSSSEASEVWNFQNIAILKYELFIPPPIKN